jgi:hypothetical protein
MRTTLDLPDDLLKRAKITAVERGTTLRELMEAALKRELSRSSTQASKRRRAKFPIFTSAAPGSPKFTNADLARLEAAEDIQRHGRDLER